VISIFRIPLKKYASRVAQHCRNAKPSGVRGSAPHELSVPRFNS
jgi:hypothetical protein